MDSAAEWIIRGAIHISSNSELVIDADEEVFILYSNLQTSTNSETSKFRGLGYVDSRKDTLTIKFELNSPANNINASQGLTRTKRPQQERKSSKNDSKTSKIIEIELAQDKTALRSRKGDTGSVLWKASIDFAQLVLQKVHDQSKDSLFNPDLLNTQHVVELGAGTGLLAVALSPLVRRYTVTDIKELVPLLRKNVTLNFDGWPNCPPHSSGSNIFVEELDWVLLCSMNSTQRRRNFSFDPIDILLIVDCIYHPSLLPALVETIDYLATPEQTAVLVVSELRADDVVREFLELWIGKAGWEIWRVGGGLLENPYVIWLGWRNKM